MKRAFVSAFVIFAVAAALPLAASAQSAHSVGSDNPMYLRDYDTNTWYDIVDGNVLVSWFGGTDSAFFYAEVHPVLITPVWIPYEFELVEVFGTNDSEIWGRWNVWRNGVLMCDGHMGKAYGLDQPVGIGTNYFKLYITDNPWPAPYAEHWHLSAFIVDRFDY